MTIIEYISELNKEFKSGRATEHSYRGFLQTLIRSIVDNVMVTNEPARIKCGAPDYIITKKEIPIGYIEAKDIGYKLDDKQYKAQFERYRKSLSNLIITDYIDFWLYIDGEFIKRIRIAEIVNENIVPTINNHSEFTNLIKDFCSHVGQTIKSSKKLAEMMAGKARMLSEVIEKALVEDEAKTNTPETALQAQLNAFKEILIHDIEPKSFADIYAQTIAYGMFAARLNDPTLMTFSRQEAAELIPKTNPFLRRLFQYIAGYDLDHRLVWIVDGLADIFRAADVNAIMKNFGENSFSNDPIIHFYETFLAEYDPKLRKARGVWYTPEPVVKFIVSAVDDILKTEFLLKEGLADTSKTTIKTKVYNKSTSDQRSKIKEDFIQKEIHKVQILDPATGTGTFLSEVVKHIYKRFEGQQGIWSQYVDTHLIPRLNGFELLMASYAMAHLNLDMLLAATGYKSTVVGTDNFQNNRFRIYLTNSLEEHHQDTGTLFANWLSSEANEANQIKRDTPVMCVIGNPPYSINSTNKGDWIINLIADYKQNLNEKKINLDDDYIKFIRYGQHFIEKNGFGVLAYITNNSFLDGITHRQMRKVLLDTFDTIYILDLHGFAKLKEVSIVAENDENVFDIQQGVSINIFIKTGKTVNKSIKYFEQYGTRKEKYNFLNENSIESISWESLNPVEPYYFFVKKDFTNQENNEKGFKINDLFVDSNSGIKTDRDELFYDSSKANLENKFRTLLSEDLSNSFIEKYKIKDSGSYKITRAIKNKSFNEAFIRKSVYRPFDYCWTYYDPSIISRPAQKAMSHFKGSQNVGLAIGRQGQVIGHMQWNLVFCINTLTDYNVFYRGGGYIFPLYSYSNSNENQSAHSKLDRVPNFNKNIVKQISTILGLEFTNEKEISFNKFAPIDILDYIYAVLHSPTYRNKYKEFLKIDFPRIPFPIGKESFWSLVKLGGELRKIHLLEATEVNKIITEYPVDGNNIVSSQTFVLKGNNISNNHPIGTVFINETQFFDKVPQSVWEFYIGGYQPAQKWLKDRRGTELSIEDIIHYQKIIVALNMTIIKMTEIDKIDFE